MWGEHCHQRRLALWLRAVHIEPLSIVGSSDACHTLGFVGTAVHISVRRALLLPYCHGRDPESTKDLRVRAEWIQSRDHLACALPDDDGYSRRFLDCSYGEPAPPADSVLRRATRWQQC